MKALLIGVAAILLMGIGWGAWQSLTDQPNQEIIEPGDSPNPPNSQTNGLSEMPTQALGQPLPFELDIQPGFAIGIFAENIHDARDLQFSPGQTLLVSVPAAGQVIALPDEDNDGLVDRQEIILRNLENPHGLAFYNDQLYVAEETQVSRYNWNEENLQAEFDRELLTLPPGGRHDTRTLTFDSEGNLYISLGSTCDTCFENHPWIATVIQTNSEGENPQVYSSGLRNAVFITTKPGTDEIWGTEMGRDLLGDELPPDEINILQEGGDYGWPICYGNQIYDEEFGEGEPADCENTIAPVYEVPAHSAPLGLKFIDSATNWPSDWQNDLLVAYHGSWNRTEPRGYEVVRLIVNGSTVQGSENFISGWYADGNTIGRPVDLEMSANGRLFISDDYAGYVYIVVPVGNSTNQ